MTQVEIQISREQLESVFGPARAWHGVYRFLAVVAFVLTCSAMITLIIDANGGGQWGLAIPAELSASFPDTSDAIFVAAGLSLCALIITLGGVYPAAAFRNRALRDIPRRFLDLVLNMARQTAMRQEVEKARTELVRRGVPATRVNDELRAIMATTIDEGRPTMDGVEHSGIGLLFYVILFVLLLPLVLIARLVSGNRR